jgi:PD-(D/E)XK nuclease superfamily
MLVPTPPAIRPLERVSPTLYEAMLKCSARAAWVASNDRSLIPSHPKALLGTAVHAVVERARAGALSGDSDEAVRTQAVVLFEQRTAELFNAAHPLLRIKFESPDRLPFYYLLEARAAQMAVELARGLTQQRTPAVEGDQLPPRRGTIETALTSADRRVAGRLDFLDQANKRVVDYKFGISGETEQISESEARQLKLYAFLAAENGIAIDAGVIERGDRTKLQLRISHDDAIEEGRRAKDALDSFNTLAGSKFEDVASPSPENCRFCPCIPFCEAFWSKSDPEWSPECGTHIEGVVASVDEAEELLSIHLQVIRGTGRQGDAVVTRLSKDWLVFDGSQVPSDGHTIRITDATYIADSSNPAVFRADRMTTAVWTVRAP